MANLQLADFLTVERLLLAEPSTNGRFADTDLVNYTNMACAQVMTRVEWPSATFSLTTDGTTREYQLPEINALLRVYLGGQPLVPTDIGTLQGDAIGIYDSFPPSDAPAWAQAPFTGYPMAQAVSAGATTASSVPYYQGQRGSYYLREGGYMGVVPPPNINASLAIDVYPVPPILVNNGDTTFFPALFKECIAWRALMYAFFALGGAGDQALQACAASYEDQINKILMPWKQGMVRNLPNQFFPTPKRRMGPPKRPTRRC